MTLTSTDLIEQINKIMRTENNTLVDSMFY